jgi:hypothetical protein
MKSIILIAAQISLLLLGITACKSDGVAANSGFRRCIPDNIRKDFNTIRVRDLESVIVQSETGYQETARPIFLIKYGKVPTGFLSACSLPEEFYQDGLKVKLSGTIYIHKNIESMNISSVPIELSSIKKVIPN